MFFTFFSFFGGGGGGGGGVLVRFPEPTPRRSCGNPRSERQDGGAGGRGPGCFKASWLEACELCFKLFASYL